ncbi:MAG: S8 family serine peptidase [Thermoleophilales bacterium]|nr:S8 family serine peptidase [Thermoleophilales bacterium]
MSIGLRGTVAVFLMLAAGAASTGPAAAQAPSNKVLLQMSYSKGLKQFVSSVSNPASKRYRQFASVRRMVSRFGPSKQARAATVRWARSNGLSARVDPSGVFATVSGDPAAIRRAFAVVTGRSNSSSSGSGLSVPPALRGIVRSASYSSDVPDFTAQARPGNLSATNPSVNQSATTRTGTPKGCPAGVNAERVPGNPGFTPNQYINAYGLKALHKRGLTGKGQRVAFIEIDGFHPGDITTFADCFGYKLPPMRTIPVQMKQPFPSGSETTLDIQVLSAAAPGLRSIDVYENLNPVLTMAAALAKPKFVPDIISISIAGCENSAIETPSLVQMLNTLFTLASGTGTSIFVATGDTGSSGCRSSSPEAPGVYPILSAQFPSTSPWVTAVGGTNMSLNSRNQLTGQWVWNGSPEVVGGGSGGISMLYGAPWWQRTGNRSSQRKVPDISALADPGPGYVIYCTSPECDLIKPGGGWMTVGGTSASTPLMAAGFALANQAAARRGQPNIGLPNPLIYKMANSKARQRIFRDVTVGDNDVGTAINPPLSNNQPVGFYKAKKGYDMATGWGSLRLDRFNDAALRYGRKTKPSR